MTTEKTFGRRNAPSAAPRSFARNLAATSSTPSAATVTVPALADSAPQEIDSPRRPTVEEELDQWKQARKVRKRSFREPWRSVSIAATIGFVATGWMLPDSVSWDAQIALGVLTIGAFYAGWRRPR